MIITGKSLPRRTFLKGVGADRGAAVPRLDGAGVRGRAAKPPVRLAFLYVPNGIDMKNWNVRAGGRAARRAAAHPQAPRGVPRRHDPGRQPDQQQRPRAARRRRRSRPLRRVVPDRRPGAEDHGRHQGQHLLRPDHRQQDRARDALRVARARHGRFAPGRRLRLGLFLRLHQQPGVAQRDAAAAADARSRACCSSGCSAPAWCSAPRTRTGDARYRRSILDFVTGDTKKLQTSLGPTDRRKLEEYLSSIREVERQLEKAEKESIAGQSRHGQALRRAARLRRALQADERHDHHRVPGGHDPRARRS